MNILVTSGHPRNDSLSSALAEAYVEGARSAGHQVELVAVRDLDMDFLSLRAPSDTGDREVILAQQELLTRCDHWVIVTPNWWWSVPALLKGYFERVLTAEFAVRYLDHFPYTRPLLTVRSVRVIYSQNAPAWAAFVTGERFWRRMKGTFLHHCGFRPARRTVFCSVNRSDTAVRAKWMAAVRQLGQQGG